MAKGAYIGIGNSSRKIKSIYAGIGNIARKVKRAYIGVGGVAKLWWKKGELTYFGTAAPLNVAGEKEGSTLGQYALFLGIQDGVFLDTYTEQLTHSAKTLTAVRDDFFSISAATLGNYSICGGQFSTDNAGDRTQMFTLDTSLTETLLNYNASDGHEQGALTQSFAIFTGGWRTTMALAYSATLTRTILYNIYDGIWDSGGDSPGRQCYGASFCKMAVFGGGRTDSGDASNSVLFDDSLTIIHTFNSNGAYAQGAATNSNYLIVAGGIRSGVNGDASPSVAYLSASLTSGYATPLSVARRGPAGASSSDFAIFLGGSYYDSWKDGVTETRDIVESYNTSLTYRLEHSLSDPREGAGAATLNDRTILVAGGVVYDDHGFISRRSAVVDVYNV